MKLTQNTRAYIYRVAAALGALGILYGFITGEELAVWLALVATVLGTGLAAGNTPTTRGRHAADAENG